MCEFPPVSSKPLSGTEVVIHTVKQAKRVATVILTVVGLMACSNSGSDVSAGHAVATPERASKSELSVGRYALIAAGDRIVKLDTATGAAWVLDSAGREWVVIDQQKVRYYNPDTGKFQDDPRPLTTTR